VAGVPRALEPVVSAGAAATSAQTPPSPPPADADRVLAALRKVKGLRIVSRAASSQVPGAVFYTLGYRQPVDHRKPKGPTFEQKLTLLHRVTADRPTVLFTSGYYAYDEAFVYEPTALVDGNQLSVEHRYFEPSRPKPADWSKLTIWQSASDFHRIVTAFRPLLSGKWISTGASKGGMATVYHRRFFPGDVDGSVAYVAPNDVDNERDDYVSFVKQAGNDRACNIALTTLQRTALQRRTRLVSLLSKAAAKAGVTFDKTLGSADRAFETTVVDTPFTFWQFGRQKDCATIPRRDATDQQIYDFIDKKVGWMFYSDANQLAYLPYYYQAASQLGWPNVSDDPDLRGLLRYREAGGAPSAVPKSLRPRSFDAKAMGDIDRWVRTQASRILFIYGENDPWSAEPFQLGATTRDSAVLWVPNGARCAFLSDLQAPDAQRAVTVLRSWAGVRTDRSASTTALSRARASVAEIERGTIDQRRLRGGLGRLP